LRVLILTDSMALPRPEVHYEKTWICSLKNEVPHHDIISISFRNLTTRYLSEGWAGDSLEFYSPDIVILQLGVVDCAPRYFISKSIFKRILSILPFFIRSIIIKLVKFFFQRKNKYSEVMLPRFDQNIYDYLIRCKLSNVRKVIIIAIGNISDTVANKSPNFRSAISIYNSVFYKYENLFPFLTVVNPLNSSNDLHFCDGYHPSEKGHKVILNSILKCQEFV